MVALEPSEARIHTGAPMGKHGIVGLAPGFHSNFLDGVGKPTGHYPLAPRAICATLLFITPGKPATELSDSPRGVVDEWGHVSTVECVEWATKVAQTEGIMVGPSAGAAIKYACDIACRPEAAGKTIVVVVGSHGIRYVQHPLWAKMKAEVRSLVITPSKCSTRSGAR